jgi:hypothetical protein
MKEYECYDDSGWTETFEADSPREAAELYVLGGNWGVVTKTEWINIWVTDPDTGELTRHKIEHDPIEPECTEDSGHVWKRPEWLGGCQENPGVWSSGGGTKGTDVCSICGLYRHWDNWAQNPSTGEQGLDSISYREADEHSIAWVDKLSD